ncbi:MAG: GNAT family protein [Actinomycetota bacterium]
MAFTVLETPRLEVRRFEVGDLAALVEYRVDPAVARYQDWDQEWSLEEAQAYLEHPDGQSLGTQGEWTQLAVVDRASGRLCGDIGIHFVEAQPSTVELGVTMSSKFQGLGLAAEAMRSVLAWLFSEFDLHRVFAHVDERNGPARALLATLGFRQEAALREADWFKGEWSTLCIYALLAEEWLRQANA